MGKAVTGVKWTGLSMVSTNILHFGALIVLARLLAPGDFGVMAMVMVVVGFAQTFSEMGMGAAVIHRQDIDNYQLSTIFWLDIIVGCFLFIFIFLSAPLLYYFFEVDDISRYLRVSAFIFLITPTGQIFQKILQKELMFDKLTKIEILRVFTYSVSTITLAYLGHGVFSLIIGQLISVAIANLCIFLIMRKIWLPYFYFRMKTIRSFLSFGIYQMGERSINYFSSNIDYLVIGKFLGAEALGFYTLAYQIITVPQKKINPTINKVAFPSFSKIQNDDARLRRGYLKVTKYVGAVAFPLLVGILAVAPEFVPVFYGNNWLPSVRIIQILSLVGILQALSNPIGSLLLAKGRADLGFKYNVFVVVVVAIASLIGIRFGAEGVAMGLLITGLFVFFPLGFYLRNQLVIISYKDYFNSLKIPFVSSAIMLFVLYLSKSILHYFHCNLTIIFCFQVIIGAVCYITVFYLTDSSTIREVKSLMLSKHTDNM
jgi:O-antigen/teichoic acid export membrane protein